MALALRLPLFNAAWPLEPVFVLAALLWSRDVVGTEGPLLGLVPAPVCAVDVVFVELVDVVLAELVEVVEAAVFGLAVAFEVWLALVAVELLREVVVLGVEPVAGACEENCIGGFGGGAGGDGAAVVASSNAAKGWVSVCCA